MVTREEIQIFLKSSTIKNYFDRNKQGKYFENQYLYSLKDVIENGVGSNDRTGTGTIRLESGYRFVITPHHIPLLRGKFVNPYGALTEVIWILTGRTDLQYLKDNGVNYWDSWVKEDGTFGPIYGHQMRQQNGFDQLIHTINKLNESPETRQAYITLWNGSDLKDQALPCCHLAYHPLIVNGKLHLHCGQRSADSFLGVPYDYMLFYFIQQILCYFTNTTPGNIVHTNNDYHIYQNHYSAVAKYMDNYINNPYNIDMNSNIVFELDFPEKPARLTSESLTDWLYEFHSCNKNFPHNYEKNVTTHHLIKAEVSV